MDILALVFFAWFVHRGAKHLGDVEAKRSV